MNCSTEIVLVGTGVGGQKQILEALNQEGIPTRAVAEMWPRDSFTYFMGRIVGAREKETTKRNHFGEGGMILTGEDYMIISEEALPFSERKDSSGNALSLEQRDSLILSKGKKYFPHARIYVAPISYDTQRTRQDDPHIDTYAMLLPQSKVLILDTYEGAVSSKNARWVDIAQKQGLTLVRYDGSKEKTNLPLNTLVLPGKNNSPELVFFNKSAKNLERLLTSLGVRPIPIDIPRISRGLPGSIHCQTNVLPIRRLKKLDKLIRRVA